MRKTTSWLLVWGGLSIGCIVSSPLAHAVKPFAPTASEIKMLPPYCAASLGKDGAAKASWQQRMGRSNWAHMHHYCHALNFLNRARFETNPQDRKYYLNNAISNFDYVLERWNPSFELSAAARKYKAQAQSMRNR